MADVGSSENMADAGGQPVVGGAFVDPEFDLSLRRAIELVDAARPMPLSASSMINKDEVLELLQRCLNNLPEEMRAARWLLKEREDFLKRINREGDEILAAARTQAEAMVQRTEVVRAAEQRARRTVEEAESKAKRLRLETEDYCDTKLGSFEIALERIFNTVKEARSRLQGDPLGDLIQEYGGESEPVVDDGFFDQDTTE
ncbi:MAG: hypothetical protein F4138_01755 [Acidimicrobiia bacterium]|nr:hypothetical protein [Acidimicrobiia bacterium]MYC57483.1 hypothetical protein [Acidimicrobiia bacterium]MYG93709.1 hypothetical protein [Acidimicrobiia bacterium]MYI30029.1 hypothetical protein [Acidimicrobiia bacterium]